MAAGPLVNVVLIPLLSLFVLILTKLDWRTIPPDFYQFVRILWLMNAVLLLFNLIPVYPLDGGQILRGLLWLKVGPIRSLKAASVIGFGGAILFGLWAFAARSIWLGIITFFIFAQAQAGWRAAQNLATESEEAARRDAAVSPPPIPERQL
jgi:Zn-dependent protease